jgi:hypothetical protein
MWLLNILKSYCKNSIIEYPIRQTVIKKPFDYLLNEIYNDINKKSISEFSTCFKFTHEYGNRYHLFVDEGIDEGIDDKFRYASGILAFYIENNSSTDYFSIKYCIPTETIYQTQPLKSNQIFIPFVPIWMNLII